MDFWRTLGIFCIIPLFCVEYYSSELNEKYGIGDVNLFWPQSFKFYLFVFLAGTISEFLIVLWLCIINFSWPYFLLLFLVCVPITGMFLRFDVFGNDDSVIIQKEPENYDFGYAPAFYFMFSEVLLIWTFLYGFGYAQFQNKYDLPFATVSLTGQILMILGLFIAWLIVLHPDKINKIFPLEIRSKEGCLIFLGGIFLLFFGYMQLVAKYFTINSTYSNTFFIPVSILVNLFVWIIIIPTIYRGYKKIRHK